jgi:hypothetical protein
MKVQATLYAEGESLFAVGPLNTDQMMGTIRTAGHPFCLCVNWLWRPALPEQISPPPVVDLLLRRAIRRASTLDSSRVPVAHQVSATVCATGRRSLPPRRLLNNPGS